MGNLTYLTTQGKFRIVPDAKRAKTRLGRVLLTRDAIADAALAYVDEHGVDALSTRKLATILGVEAMSLYHHFTTKDALLDAVAERLTLKMEVRKARPGADAVEAFVQGSRGLYRLAQHHPKAFPLLALRRANTPRAMAFYDALVAPLLEAGLSPEDAALVFRTVGYYTLGAALARIATFTSGENATPPPLEDPERATNLPNLRAIARHLTSARVDPLFERGLGALTAGLRAELSPTHHPSRRATAP